MFAEAVGFARSIVADGGTVLFVGHQALSREAVQKEAARCSMPYVNQRWPGGMLTNFKTIRQSIKRLTDLTDLQETGALEKRGKKEPCSCAAKWPSWKRAWVASRTCRHCRTCCSSSTSGMSASPCTRPRSWGIPVIAVVDTNCSPEDVEYIVPGNDDAMRAINLYASAMADAVLEGKSAVPQVVVGEDEFVELDESGAPRRRPARPGRARPQAAVRRKPTRAPAAEGAADAAVAPAEIAEADLDEPVVNVQAAPVKEAAGLRRRPVANGAGARRGGGRS